MKKVLSFVMVAVLLATLCACGGEAPASSAVAAVAIADGNTPMAGPAPAQDRAGNPIVVPEQVNKIVSLAASTTRVLCDLGLGGQLVAVDTYSVDNLSANVPQDILLLDMMAPDLEQLAQLAPDIIFVSNLSSAGGADIFAPLKESGICVADIPTPVTVAGIFEDVQFIADCTGKSAEGARLVQDAQDILDNAAALLAQTNERPTVYFEVSPSPNLYSTGAGTYLNELVTLAGGSNIFKDQDSWIAVTEESVVTAAPDVIFTAVDFLPEPTEEILARAGWETVPAVENAAVYSVDTAASQQPTHHVAEAVWQMLEYLHPELAAGQTAA